MSAGWILFSNSAAGWLPQLVDSGSPKMSPPRIHVYSLFRDSVDSPRHAPATGASARPDPAASAEGARSMPSTPGTPSTSRCGRCNRPTAAHGRQHAAGDVRARHHCTLPPCHGPRHHWQAKGCVCTEAVAVWWEVLVIVVVAILAAWLAVQDLEPAQAAACLVQTEAPAKENVRASVEPVGERSGARRRAEAALFPGARVGVLLGPAEDQRPCTAVSHARTRSVQRAACSVQQSAATWHAGGCTGRRCRHTV